MRIATIKAELVNNAAIYGALTDAQAGAELNKAISMVKPKNLTTLSIFDLLGSLEATKFLTTLEGLAGVNDATGNAVRLATRSIDSVGVDVGNTNTRTMLDQLALAGVLVQASVDTVKAAANVQTTRAQEIGLSTVRTGEVTRARM